MRTGGGRGWSTEVMRHALGLLGCLCTSFGIQVRVAWVKHASGSAQASRCACIGMRVHSSAQESESRSKSSHVWKGEECKGKQVGSCL